MPVASNWVTVAAIGSPSSPTSGWATFGGVVARLRGRDTGRKPLLLLAHLDVVEADPADWSVDPFTFLERDGYYYGRGTTDDKAQAVIHTANLIRLRQEGFVPERDIIVALTSDEEGGAHNGVVWLLANYRELIDAGLALNEGARAAGSEAPPPTRRVDCRGCQL